MSERYTVWGVDRAGSPWDIASFENPLHALRRLHVEEAAMPSDRSNLYGIYDDENPEAGDISYRLEESFCNERCDSGERCYTPLDADELCAFRGFHRDGE